jgi:hypothetical protein
MTKECQHVINFLSNLEEEYNNEPELVDMLKDEKKKIINLINNRESFSDLSI